MLKRFFERRKKVKTLLEEFEELEKATRKLRWLKFYNAKLKENQNA